MIDKTPRHFYSHVLISMDVLQRYLESEWGLGEILLSSLIDRLSDVPLSSRNPPNKWSSILWNTHQIKSCYYRCCCCSWCSQIKQRYSKGRQEQRSECQALPIFCRYWNKVSILSEICVCLFVYYLLVAARSFRAVSCYCHKYQHWSKKWTVKSDFISSSEAIYLRKKLAYRAKLFLLKPKKESMHYPCW